MTITDKKALKDLLRVLCCAQDSVTYLKTLGKRHEDSLHKALGNRERCKQAIVTFVEGLTERITE